MANFTFKSRWLNFRVNKEWFKVGAVILIYSIVAFYNLGSLQAPETYWQSKLQSDYIVFDLGEIKQIEQVVIFSGTSHKGSYVLSTYEKGKWIEQLIIENKHTYALAHQVWDMLASSQYVMLKTLQPNYTIHELAFFNSLNELQPLQVSVNQYSSEVALNSSPMFLIDEQAMMKAKPTYMDGSYFDEIYHARTAVEYLNESAIYETTHPPLGKLFIALGIKLFGFSPFGWRFMGTFVGVAVLLILYYFTKLIFKHSSYALTAMLLFAVDFMHFTQSRIATIDIYLVCFNLLMFLFMTRYSMLNFYHVRFWKTLIPLALSGIYFGISIAIKWNGFYGGAGLALMLIIVLIQRYKESKKYFWRPFGLTIGYCCIFFVLIPAAIYYFIFQLSFYLSGDKLGLVSFIEAQQSMYSYHSALVATHPFSSSWYEWQVIVRPIWYYINNNLHQPELTSTIAAFGNPLIWWFSIATMLATLVWSIYKRHVVISVIYIGYFSQLLPWIFVDRITFIYHFFGMVPFIILSIVYFFQQIEQRYKSISSLRWHFVIVAAILFVMFYPVLSGEPVARFYVDHALRWFNSWYF